MDENNYIPVTTQNSKWWSYTDDSSFKHIKSSNTHAMSVLVEGNRHKKELTAIENKHIETLKNKELWVIGRLFGGKELTAINISGILIIMLLIIGVIFSLIIICQKKEDQTISIVDIWSITTPLITLALGYIFGNKNNIS